MLRTVNRSCANCKNGVKSKCDIGGFFSDISFCDQWESSQKYWEEVLAHSEQNILKYRLCDTDTGRRYFVFWNGVRAAAFQVLQTFDKVK
ncbi:hypothetical protein FTV88_2271 [Heliorestis convoluta]|uniref:Uncharacterized protein n=1 Tax=Heliorestis convoluta TaxID=356322 RepID=A0A5Q2N3C8_9FIRM|nr:hypothetical protein FTV88_2271 [Heliorestis convoluta]